MTHPALPVSPAAAADPTLQGGDSARGRRRQLWTDLGTSLVIALVLVGSLFASVSLIAISLAPF
ncbi:MAG: hypothetical protein JOY84_07990 [Curvibacter sp.]|nr:hypothetical protein [Curvibacter sp.]